LRLSFGFCWPLCVFVHYTYLVTYLLDVLLLPLACLCLIFIFWSYCYRSEWVSSFLTPRQHILGYFLDLSTCFWLVVVVVLNGCCRMLLWHGSRLTNMVGILSSGLRVAPPEAPVTGYMVCVSIYLSDFIDAFVSVCGVVPFCLWHINITVLSYCLLFLFLSVFYACLYWCDDVKNK